MCLLPYKSLILQSSICRKWKIPELSLSPQRMLGPVRHRFCRALLVSLFERCTRCLNALQLKVLSSPLKQSLCRVKVFSCLDRYAPCFNAIPERAPQLGDVYYSHILENIVCRKKEGVMDETPTRCFNIFLLIRRKCLNSGLAHEILHVTVYIAKSSWTKSPMKWAITTTASMTVTCSAMTLAGFCFWDFAIR
jgi:hypothetical protein